jgi:hypothetical protein
VYVTFAAVYVYVNTWLIPPNKLVVNGCAGNDVDTSAASDAVIAGIDTFSAVASPMFVTCTVTTPVDPVPSDVGFTPNTVATSVATDCTVTALLVNATVDTAEPLFASTPLAVPCSVTLPEPTAE